MTASDLRVIARIARRTHALVFDSRSMRSWSGHLFVDRRGAHEQAAFAPDWMHICCAKRASVAAAGQVARKFGIALNTGTKRSEFLFDKAFQRQLKYLALNLASEQAASRAKQLTAFYRTSANRVELVALRPNGGEDTVTDEQPGACDSLPLATIRPMKRYARNDQAKSVPH